jgi:hypothetical protein
MENEVKSFSIFFVFPVKPDKVKPLQNTSNTEWVDPNLFISIIFNIPNNFIQQPVVMIIDHFP